MTAHSATVRPIAAALLPWRVDPRSSDRIDRLDDAFHQIATSGFTAVDLTDTCLPFGDLRERDTQAVARLVETHGLEATAISVVRRSVAHPDPTRSVENLEYSLRAVDVAAALEVPVVSVGLHVELTAEQREAEWFWAVSGHKDPDNAERWHLAVTRIQAIADHAATFGIEISLEMYEDTYLGSIQSSLSLLDDIDRPNVGLNPDTGNLLRVHGPIEDWQEVLQATLPRANYWHMKNYLRSHDPRTGSYFTAPTSLELGVINYRRALQIANACGYSGPFCLEHYGGDGLGVCATNLAYLRRLTAGMTMAYHGEKTAARPGQSEES